MNEDAISAALLATNKEMCIPPLSDSEVLKISHSMARYEPIVLSCT